jgi:hypothetical protein
MRKEAQMIDAIADRAAVRKAAAANQHCGPVRHFIEQERAGALGELWRCRRCGHVNQPFSSQQAALMRRAARLKNGAYARNGDSAGNGFSRPLYRPVTSR